MRRDARAADRGQPISGGRSERPGQEPIFSEPLHLRRGSEASVEYDAPLDLPLEAVPPTDALLVRVHEDVDRDAGAARGAYAGERSLRSFVDGHDDVGVAAGRSVAPSQRSDQDHPPDLRPPGELGAIRSKRPHDRRMVKPVYRDL
jgi:hypothetical protein